MGVRQRTVKQTITEVICDYCKRPVKDAEARVGTLATRMLGQRGRPKEIQVAFHAACVAKITDTASKAGAARRGNGRRVAAKKPATKAATGGSKTRRGRSTAKAAGASS